MTLPDIDGRVAARVIAAMAFLLAAAAIAVHAPGQVSMDTSVQLHEASIGRSISWNPPFMSALLRWLGGGELAKHVARANDGDLVDHVVSVLRTPSPS